MERRPRLLVFLAILFCISPFLYPLLVAFYFGTPLVEVLRETLRENNVIRNAEIFLLPIALGFFTFFARRISFFVVIVGSFYLIARNVFIFVSTNRADPIVALVLMNLFFLFVILYLSRRDTRMIYFNEKMRWWETDPRYVVNFQGSLIRLGAPPIPVKISNIAVGGAAIATNQTGFIPHEMVHVEFQHEGETFKLTAGVVWEATPGSPEHVIGIQWVEDLLETDRQKVVKLMRALRSKGIPETRESSQWWRNFRAWLSRSS